MWRVAEAVVLFFVLLLKAGTGQTFVEDTFDDFIDGTLDASGQNLYVSRDGWLKTIHRFDLNQDSYIDLVFNNTHDRRSFIPATLGTIDSSGQVRHQALAVEGSRQVAVSDLNRDGFLDLVFCPNRSSVQTGRRFLTIIYGGSDGWPSYRANGLLPVHSARKVTVADLNADHWPDIVTLNSEAWQPGQPRPGKIVRIYWGDEGGFLLTRYHDLQVEGAVDIDAADFDEDDVRDLAVLTDQQTVLLYWARSAQNPPKTFEQTTLRLPRPGATTLLAADATGEGISDLIVGTDHAKVYLFPRDGKRGVSEVRTVSAFDSSQIAVGELDGDGRPDLVLTNFVQNLAAGGELSGARSSSDSSIKILWGAEAWDRANAASIHLPFATATAVGDLNSDGKPDLAIAVHQGERTYRTDSVLLLNEGNRRFSRTQLEVPTEGATHVAIAPREKHQPPRVVFANSLGGMVGEMVSSQVYWGGPQGFDLENQWRFPMRSGYESSAADLNNDGHVDLVALNSGHAGAIARSDPTLGASIFWGAADGFDIEERRTVLNELNLGSSNIADLNRDGYLDIVLGSFDPTYPLVVYFGSEEGFARSRRAAIPCKGRSTEGVIADFNRDGWLDIAVASYVAHRVRVFWGSADGYSESRQSGIDVPSPIGLESADLNGDKQLDLVVATYRDPVSGHHDTGLLIFWGSDEEFEPWNAQWLPGFTPISPVVADFDADGFLDLFSPHYHADLTRELLPNYLYWGSKTGFHPRRRTALICNSAHDGLAADFDRDGDLDLAVVCHSTDGDHTTYSKVFYNNGSRFQSPKVEKLLAHGPHWMWSQDMGHIYHRRWEQTYESSIFSWEEAAKSAAISYEAEIPEGTTLSLAVRAASRRALLEDGPWRPVRGDVFPLRSEDRFLQYRARLVSDNGDRYPALDRVAIRPRP